MDIAHCNDLLMCQTVLSLELVSLSQMKEPQEIRMTYIQCTTIEFHPVKVSAQNNYLFGTFSVDPVREEFTVNILAVIEYID